MAVENKYVNSDVTNGKLVSSLRSGQGINIVTMVETGAVAAADDNGSIYRFFKAVPSNYIPVEICIHNEAITGGTDYDLGLYETGEDAAVVDKDILADGLDLSGARAISAWNNDGMKTIALQTLSTLATLSAQTRPSASYDIALTANTVGSGVGNIRITARFAVL